MTDQERRRKIQRLEGQISGLEFFFEVRQMEQGRGAFRPNARAQALELPRLRARRDALLAAQAAEDSDHE